MIDLTVLQQTILDHLHDGVYVVDRDRRILYWNRSAQRISGYDAARMVGARCSDNTLVHVNDAGCLLCHEGCPLTATLADGLAREADVYLRHADGYRLPVSVQVLPLRDKQGKVVAAVEFFRDVSGLRNMTLEMENLRQAALIDPLTELGNRRYLESMIGRLMEESRRYRWPFGLLFIDVDHFKQINDRYGHEIGDRTLRMVGRTLAQNVRAYDMVGRWGGEEFVALIKNVQEGDFFAVAEKLRLLVGESRLPISNDNIDVTISVGGSIARENDTMESLVRRADELMYRCKQSGRNCVVIE